MEKIVEQGLLYDFYGELLTKHQRKIYEDAVNNDYSLSEMADELGITRQGVHDLLKRCDKTLQNYEEKLHLIQKFISIKEKITKINEITNMLVILEKNNSGNYCNEERTSQLQLINQLSIQILEEL